MREANKENKDLANRNKQLEKELKAAEKSGGGGGMDDVSVSVLSRLPICIWIQFCHQTHQTLWENRRIKDTPDFFQKQKKRQEKVLIEMEKRLDAALKKVEKQEKQIHEKDESLQSANKV